MAKQRVLIIGHSFVHRLQAFVQKRRHTECLSSLNSNAEVIFHGIESRTISKFREYDPDVVKEIAPDIIILELGSNDLVKLPPQTVSSELESLVQDLHNTFSIKFVVVSQVLRRYTKDSVDFNCKVGKLHQCLKVVLERRPYCYYWRHSGFWNCNPNLYLSDGVHLNSLGNYKFMRRIGGAILKALKLVGVPQA